MKNYLFLIFLFVSTLVFGQQKDTDTKEKKKDKAAKTVDDDKPKPINTGEGKPKPIITGEEKTNENLAIFPMEPVSRWTLGLSIGGSYNFFDIEQDVINPVFGGFLKYSASPILAFRLHGTYGTYSGKSTELMKKDYGFANNITQVGLNVMVNLGTLSFKKKHPNTNLYAFTGLTFAFSDAIRDKKIGTATTKGTYTGTDLTVPVGVGIKFKMSEEIDLGLEAVVNATRIDSLDMYGGAQNYPDFFGSFAVTVGYKFVGQKRKTHVDWYNPVSTMYDDLSKKAAQSQDEMKKDSDGDGVPDYLDNESNTKPGYKVDVKGVALDSDVDGIPDSADPDPFGFNQMLSTYYPAVNMKNNASVDVLGFNDSIPEAEFVTLSGDGYGLPVVTFPPNKYDIHVEQYPLLHQIARIMTVDTSVMLAVIGHADNNKPDLTQLTIAEKRALAVKRQLTKIYEIDTKRVLVFSERDVFVRKYKLNTEGLDRKVEFRLIRKK